MCSETLNPSKYWFLKLFYSDVCHGNENIIHHERQVSHREGALPVAPFKGY